MSSLNTNNSLNVTLSEENNSIIASCISKITNNLSSLTIKNLINIRPK